MHSEELIKPGFKNVLIRPEASTLTALSSAASRWKITAVAWRYRAAKNKEVLMEFRGSVEQTLQAILSGMCPAFTHVGRHQLKGFTKRITGIRMAQQFNQAFEKSQAFHAPFLRTLAGR